MKERCVYVKEAVLSALEREKRGLKWQLARTAKIAEARAADVVACESKVKDLLTIVEMNKSVTDRAVKRTYSQESQLQRVTLERDECQHRLLVQRRRAFALRDLQSGDDHAFFPTPEFLFDECFRLRFKRRLELKRVSFLAWKVEWRLTKTKEKTARHHLQTSLWRRVLRGWRHHIKSKKRRHELLSLALDRRRRLVFRAWSITSHCIAKRRKLLIKILTRQRRKLLQRFLTRLRVKCLERATREWADVLKAAHEALEEEKLMYSLHQDAAMKEIHASYMAQEQSRAKFLELQSHRLSQNKELASMRRHFAAWQWRMTRMRLHDRVASHGSEHWYRSCSELSQRWFVVDWPRNDVSEPS
ncbi:hypothetical protein Gpo141_00007583 [Globisporangium polare]